MLPSPEPAILLVAAPDAVPALAAWMGGRRVVGAVTTREAGALMIGGVRVLGSLASLADALRLSGATTVVACVPRAVHAVTDRLASVCGELGVALRHVPTPDDVLAGNCHRAGASPDAADPDRLIGRTPRGLTDDARARARRLLEGRRVLITGAGGSIGSELARVVASFDPSELILMERAENALFEIDRRLARERPSLPRRSMLHDVVEERATRDWLDRLRPHVVFHAAAHKHVTVMEDHPAHAVNNNFFGTRAIADAAVAAGAERFVMISTDKAVNPTSVMGATKRFAERYVAALNRRAGSATRCCMVRFGNVLGSACSVAPIWSRQIAEGGPVTVTHPEMTRYFMTIPEAAQLVIQAGALTDAEAAGADVFVLDMGDPVRIVELAERFVRQAGLEPLFVDRATPGSTPPGAMEIVFTGARPGEKLHEELAYTGEQLRPTPAEGVLAWAWSAEESTDAADRLTTDLEAIRWSADRETVLETITRHAPTVAAGRARTTNLDSRENPHLPASHQRQTGSGRRQSVTNPADPGVNTGSNPAAA